MKEHYVCDIFLVRIVTKLNTFDKCDAYSYGKNITFFYTAAGFNYMERNN